MSRKEVNQIISRMANKIKSKYHPQKVILFGSYAYGKPHRDSDVDLFVVKNTQKNPIDRCVEVRKIIREENRFVPISLLVYTPAELKKKLDLEDDFILDVLNKGKILYG